MKRLSVPPIEMLSTPVPPPLLLLLLLLEEPPTPVHIFLRIYRPETPLTTTLLRPVAVLKYRSV